MATQALRPIPAGMLLVFPRIFVSSLAIGATVACTFGCEKSDASNVEETSEAIVEEPARHPHDGMGAPPSAAPHGAAPHGAAPHGAAPHGAAPHGAAPHGAAPHGAAPHGAAPAAATPGAGMPEVAVTWTTPGEWKKMPKRSMMRAATYQAEGAAGAAEIAVFYFGPGQGGDVESNIARWVGQFQETASDAVARSTRDANGLKQYLVRVSEGTFSSGMPGGPAGPQKEWGMEAAIVETPSGSYFFKMTGPAKTVSQHSEAFHSMLKSIKTKG